MYELLSRYHGDTVESGAVYSTVVCIVEKCYVPLCIIIQLHLKNKSVSLVYELLSVVTTLGVTCKNAITHYWLLPNHESLSFFNLLMLQ